MSVAAWTWPVANRTESRSGFRIACRAPVDNLRLGDAARLGGSEFRLLQFDLWGSNAAAEYELHFQFVQQIERDGAVATGTATAFEQALSTAAFLERRAIEFGSISRL